MGNRFIHLLESILHETAKEQKLSLDQLELRYVGGIDIEVWKLNPFAAENDRLVTAIDLEARLEKEGLR